MAEERILVVDDEYLIRWTLEQNLTKEGYQVLVAQTGEEALEKVEQEALDLVLLDIKLPGMDGYEVLEKLLQKDRNIVPIMITAFDDEGRLGASQISQLDADLKPEVFRDITLGGVRLHQEIDVPVKSIAMRLGVEDVANSHIGTIEIPLPVKAPPDAPIVARRSLPPIEPD